MSDLLNSTRSSLDKPLPSIASTDSNSNIDVDIVAQVREACFSPSPLAEILQDPSLVKSLTRPKRPSRRPSTSSGLERSRSKDRSDTTSVLTVVLAEEERQGNHLKALLRSAGDRLDAELRRADQAETRAEFSESRARDLQIRLSSSDASRHQAELEAARSKEEVRRYQMQAEIAERELQRLRSNVTTLTRQKDDAEREANKAKESARDYLQKIREYEAREDGREEGRRIGHRKGYNVGWEECWPVAHAEGHARGFEAGQAEGFEDGREEGYKEGKSAAFEEGRKKGKAEGFNEGLEKGRKEERDKALDAFDLFLAEEVNESGHEPKRNDRTHLWVQSLKNAPKPHQLQPPVLHQMASQGRITLRSRLDSDSDDNSSNSSQSLVLLP